MLLLTLCRPRFLSETLLYDNVACLHEFHVHIGGAVMLTLLVFHIRVQYDSDVSKAVNVCGYGFGFLGATC